MDQQTMQRTTSRARAVRQDCHGEECASGSRNNYYLGKHLTPDSYSSEQGYSIARRRLINRTVLGSGVVYGFALSDSRKHGRAGQLEISEGLALDLLGRELIQTHEATVSIDNLLILDDGVLTRVDGDLNERFNTLKCGTDDCWMLSVHYAEKKLGHLTIKDPCHCDREEWDRTCETVVYSLKRVDCKECCKPFECKLHCCCPKSRCCAPSTTELEECDDRIRQVAQEYERELAQLGQQDPKKRDERIKQIGRHLEDEVKKRNALEAKNQPRGGCSCLCEHQTEWEPRGEYARLTDVDDCTHADLGNGVQLACVKLVKDECDKWSIEEIVDACGPRQLVKRTDELFDLINGCDLTRIDRTGWERWHRRSVPAVPFSEFADALGWKGESENPVYMTRDFWVHFSRPVQTRTLKPDAFAMAVMSDHGDDFWRTYRRVPVMAVKPERDKDDPPGYASKATIFIATNWLSDAIRDDDHMFARGETRVEIEVRGDLILDCLGQQVDANSRGRLPAPSGNGSPGGTYLSTFTVSRRVVRERKPPPKPKDSYAQAAPPPNSEQPDDLIL
jgi:hypothetical protein